ncbi:bifunctional DNA primase/polymerase [Mycolicibacterium septicum]|uniref:Bifunctional DNA primase/polymerase n=1 Tax=Mycolicibacterium septicum TaxID=98668 RepID=A0ABW9LNG5_9MYCO
MSAPFSPEELQRVAANRAALADALAAREAEIDTWLERLSDAEAVLMPLMVAGKRPVESKWQETSTIDWDAIEEHVRRGGNVGAHLGASRWVGWDGDNAPATAAMLDAGFDLFTVSAGSRNPAHNHAGGAHCLWRLPGWVPLVRLTGPTKAVVLENGASIDVLAGHHQVVVPPSVVVIKEPVHYIGTYATASEAGYCDPDRDGWLKVAAADDGVLPELPLWALSDELLAYAPEGTVVGEPPAGWEPMAGAVTVWREADARVREPGEGDDELTTAVDQLDLLSMLEAAGIAGDRAGFDSCGPCETWLRKGSDAEKSMTVHDCDQHGARVQVWTTAFADLPQGGHSRLDAYCGLTGRERGAVMKELGLVLPRSLSFADQLDDAADAMEQRAEDPTQCTSTVTRPDPAAVPQLVSLVDGVQTSRTSGEIEVPATADFWRREAGGMRSLALLLRGDHHRADAVLVGADSVVGAPVHADLSEPIDAETVELPSQAEPTTDTAPAVDAEVVDETTAASSSPSNALAVDDAVEGEFVDAWEDGDQEMWTRHRAIEAELRGERDPDTKLWTGMVACLGRIANIAESRGIYMLGFTEACLPRVSARVPANVLLTPRADGIREKSEGVGMGYNSILLGPPATGKTTTQTAASGAIPLLPGIRQCSTGSAEGVIKKARSVSGKGGEETIHATSVYVETDEIKSQNKDLKRDGSMYSAFINSVFFGGTMVGMTASEASRNADIPAHSTRFAQQIGAQPQLCGLLLDDAGSGITARFSWAFTGSVDESALGPLYGKAVPALLPNGLPWDPPTGIPFGFRPYTGPAASDDEDEVPVHEIENIEALPAEWIVVPRDPEEVAAARAESARRSRRTRAALTEDRESGRTSGHDFVRIEKTAALLAFMDGIKQPTEEYVAAAKLLAEATALAAAEAKAQSDSEDEAKARRGGRLRGIEHLHGNAVAKQEGADAVEAAADALYAKLTRPPEGVFVKGKKAKGFGGQTTYGELTAASCVRPEHRPFREAGMALLIQQERITVSAVGNDRRTYTVTAVGAVGQLTAAPAIGSLNA